MKCFLSVFDESMISVTLTQFKFLTALFNAGTPVVLSSDTICYKHRIISATGFSAWQGRNNNWKPADVVSSVGARLLKQGLVGRHPLTHPQKRCWYLLPDTVKAMAEGRILVKSSKGASCTLEPVESAPSVSVADPLESSLQAS